MAEDSGPVKPNNAEDTDEVENVISEQTLADTRRLGRALSNYEVKANQVKLDHLDAMAAKESECQTRRAKFDEDLREESAKTDSEIKMRSEEREQLQQELSDMKLNLDTKTERVEYLEGLITDKDNDFKTLKDDVKRNHDEWNEKIETIQEGFQKRFDSIGYQSAGRESYAKTSPEFQELSLELDKTKLELVLMEKEKLMSDTTIEKIQDRCDKEVQAVREKFETEKEYLRKELQRENDENRSALKAEMDKTGQELASIKKKLKEERVAHHLALEKEKNDNRKHREEQQTQYDDFKKLLEEEKKKEIREVRNDHGMGVETLNEKHEAEVKQLQDKLEEQSLEIKNIQSKADEDTKETNERVMNLTMKHIELEKDSLAGKVKERKKFEKEVEALQKELSEKRDNIMRLEFRITVLEKKGAMTK